MFNIGDEIVIQIIVFKAQSIVHVLVKMHNCSPYDISTIRTKIDNINKY